MSNEETNATIDAAFEKQTASERKFCEEMEFTKNKYGVYLYESQKGGHSSFNLVAILEKYKEWLIENNILQKI